ncbi:MAG: chemotaxis protein CheR [Rhodospirillales bacterium]|nr:chemotaxis protein CheR [Rhodospirillales bacterium]
MSASKIFPIAGVGASAGGIEALVALFAPMTVEIGMAFVVVTHLPPGHESMLGEILARHTALSVAIIEDGQTIEPNRVYVLPHEASLTIEQGRLRMGGLPPGVRVRNPIDTFFSALADDQGVRAIGIVLSGGGSDGTLGAKAIKECGGLTLAQGSDHTSPRHASMPLSAIGSGMVDLVLSVEAMAAKLATYGKDLREENTGETISEIETAKDAIYKLLRNRLGHDFAGYKDKAFLRRVQRRMQVLQLKQVGSYVEHLRQDGNEAQMLFRDLLISVTDFFRDAAAFAALSDEVIPHLFEGKGADDTVRVWVPGCATGEEAYSIAILMREHMDGLPGVPKVQVFGTDIDETALSIARTGRYPNALLKAVTPERARRFFTGDGPSRVIAKEVRDLCVFSAHSLIRDPPFSRLDLVSCRNLLIYFSADLQNQVIPIFHYALQPNGFLFFGLSENVTQHADLFAPIDKKHRIFRRRDHLPRRPPLPLRIPGLASVTRPDPHRHSNAGSLNLRQTAENHLLEHHTPAYVVVNRDHDIVYYSAGTGKYLEAAAGMPNRQILAVARKGLRLELRMALREANETRRSAMRERITVEIDDRLQLVTLKIDPLVRPDNELLFLVLFVDVGAPVAAEAFKPQRPPEQHDVTITRLERELNEHRDRLQVTIEEYETAIEELVSGNEEVQSTNEELESSKEELQSLNEEILTVNGELNRKIEALDEANSDLKNLFESTQIATVFLDRHLVIRSFTPAVTEIFNLIPSDCGRPLTDIASRLDAVNLRRELQAVLQSRQPVERRLTADDGVRHYVMRLLPYRASDDSIDGLLVTFIDITSIVASEAHQRLLIAELNHRVRNMLAVVIGIATKTIAQTPELQPFAETFLGRLHALAGAYEPLSRVDWGHVPLRDIVMPQIEPHLKDPEQARIEGPQILLHPKAALALGLVIHELSINAAKHGALSLPDGTVAVEWRRDDGVMVLEWRETGGPPVKQPRHRGFGSELIERAVNYEMDGETSIEFAPDGVKVLVKVPLSELSATDAGEAIPS